MKPNPITALSKTRFTAETQRTLRESSYDPIGPSPRPSGFARAGGRRRSDHKLLPSGDRFKVAFPAYGGANHTCSDIKERFLFGSLSPPNKKIIPLRAPRLCGEISVLDKSDSKYTLAAEQRGIISNGVKVFSLMMLFLLQDSV